MNSQSNVIKFFRFLKSKVFLKNLVFALIGGFVLIFITLMILRMYTHHGETISVPNFVGLSMKEVEDLADDRDLKYEIIDSVFNAIGRPGSVVDQTPPPNFKVKTNRTIFITIKALQAEIIAMPNFKGVSINQARADIETYGLKIGRLIYRPDIAKNNVLDQIFDGKSIKPGEKIKKGSKIDFILGTGTGEELTTFVPNLIGLSQQDASLKSAESSLNIGSAIYDNSVKDERDSLNARVYKQSPLRNVVARMGGEIDIWLTIDESKFEEDND